MSNFSFVCNENSFDIVDRPPNAIEIIKTTLENVLNEVNIGYTKFCTNNIYTNRYQMDPKLCNSSSKDSYTNGKCIKDGKSGICTYSLSCYAYYGNLNALPYCKYLNPRSASTPNTCAYEFNIFPSCCNMTDCCYPYDDFCSPGVNLLQCTSVYRDNDTLF